MLPEVCDVIDDALRFAYGNPSSLHREGRMSRTLVEDARKSIAHHFNASIGEIFFTSGGTEANNTVIKSAVQDLGVQRIISSPVEHPCVLKVLESLEGRVVVEFVKLHTNGRADLEDLRNRLAEGPKTLVSLMHINNEIGTINPIAEIGEICREKDALFHTDTVQGIGYYRYDLNALNINYLSASAHKFHGPKGVGFLYMDLDHPVKPLIHGGQQERNLRAGTENIPYIAGMARALDLAYSKLEDNRKVMQDLRQLMKRRMSEELPEVRIVNMEDEGNHYKIMNLAVPLTPKSELAILNMDMAGFAISGGSACSSGAETQSHVYDSLFPGEDIKMLRISFSHLNRTDEVEDFVQALKGVL